MLDLKSDHFACIFPSKALCNFVNKRFIPNSGINVFFFHGLGLEYFWFMQYQKHAQTVYVMYHGLRSSQIKL